MSCSRTSGVAKLDKTKTIGNSWQSTFAEAFAAHELDKQSVWLLFNETLVVGLGLLQDVLLVKQVLQREDMAVEDFLDGRLCVETKLPEHG